MAWYFQFGFSHNFQIEPTPTPVKVSRNSEPLVGNARCSVPRNHGALISKDLAT